MSNQPNKEQCEKLYDAVKSGKIDAEKIMHDLEANLALVSKIAKQTSKEEFVDAMNGEMPALRLTPQEMEALKAGNKIGILNFIVDLMWWQGDVQGNPGLK
jgi:hypothetical protein